MIHATDSTFQKEVLQSKTPVVVDFYADWCGPCKMMAPSFEEASKELTKIKFIKVNVDENPEHAGDFGVMSIPCLILFKNGEEADRQTGTMTKTALKEWLNEQT